MPRSVFMATKRGLILRSEPREGRSLLLDETIFARLAQLAQQPGVVAIGEIGLDYHYNFSPPDVQRAVLARQLELAHELGLPVILHNRESDQDLRQIVDAAPAPLRGVLHCFLADQAMADWALARGLYMGVAGPITFKNVRHLPEIIRRVPFDRLLIETDCPYLAPHPKRGRRNEPAYVRYVAEGLARVLSLSPEEVAERSTGKRLPPFGDRVTCSPDLSIVIVNWNVAVLLRGCLRSILDSAGCAPRSGRPAYRLPVMPCRSAWSTTPRPTAAWR